MNDRLTMEFVPTDTDGIAASAIELHRSERHRAVEGPSYKFAQDLTRVNPMGWILLLA